MTPLTPRGQATKDKLVAAAREVFAERGFAATRMGDIADAAGVAHGTVYTYFEKKEDVLLGVLEHVARDLHEAMAPLRVPDPIARVQAAIRRYIAAYRAHARLLRVAEEAAGGDERVAEVLVALRRAHVARVAATIANLQGEGLAAQPIAREQIAIDVV